MNMPTTYAAALLARACAALIARVDAEQIGPDDDGRFTTALVEVADEFGVSIAALETEAVRELEERGSNDGDGPSWDEDEAMYGRDDSEPTYGPARLRDDGYYARNDAGEYSWM